MTPIQLIVSEEELKNSSHKLDFFSETGSRAANIYQEA
jgi:hypothetical protein